MQPADFSVLGTYERHYRSLLKLLGTMDLPLSSAMRLAGEEALRRCAFTPLVTSIALSTSLNGLTLSSPVPTPDSGPTPEAGESQNSSQSSKSSLNSPTSSSSRQLMRSQEGPNRAQRRAQQAKFKKFMKQLQAGSGLRTLSTAGTK